MQLKSLRMFEAVCDSGSFGAAAQQLHTVQSNVTAHIKKLEEEVGAQLLSRANPVFPTPAGRTPRQSICSTPRPNGAMRPSPNSPLTQRLPACDSTSSTILVTDC